MVDLETRCDEAFDQCLAYARSIHDDNNWTVYREDDGLIYSSHSGETDHEVIRGQMIVKKTPEEVFNFLSIPFNKREFDYVLTTLDVIEDFGRTKCIFYQNNLPWPLDPREAVYSEGTHKDPDGT
ncbi:hypothetical protein SteCoe_16074 [Stentor coeruleus]|uniref:START domain-containing protein n=1 Tax=Stentor coeruleus TaxID=5963 RepID=A0A1R2C232_9CILI|nr:hypothetical protein SteCoe_16074 [Stentor coeruleus]